MSILVNKYSRVIVQGFTGKEATFHSSQMIEYGTTVVGGVTPGKGGTKHLNLPVFNSVTEALKSTVANVSIIFVPANHAADAIMEATDAGIELIVAITEGIPIQDMLKVYKFLSDKKTRLIGPNCPGIITPGECKIGIMPGYIHSPGTVGIVSRSGTLSYEAVAQITQQGYGQSTMIGIGGDPIIGTSMLDVVKLFNEDKDTDAIVLIGEIGGNMETEAALWLKDNCNKPVVSFIAGATAPRGRTMGHAGAIISSADDTAQSKKGILRKCGICVVDSPADIGINVKKLLTNGIRQ